MWRETFTFDYETKFHAMQKEKLKIKLVDRSGSKLGRLKIPLIEICTGSTHFDYKIIKDSRIFFDIVMSQEVEFQFQIKSLEAHLIRPLMAPRYYFSFSVLEKESEKSTPMSEAFENNTQNEFLLENLLKHKENTPSLDRKMSVTHKQFVGESQKTYDLIKVMD